MKDNTKKVIAEQQAINRKLWALENGTDANKLIAEFMGLHDEISLDSIAGNIHSWSDSPFFYITEDSKEKVIEGITKYSKYHTSWDWLMPVVQKCFESTENEDDFFSISGNLPYIEETYKSVVEFINEYNDGCHQTYNDERINEQNQQK